MRLTLLSLAAVAVPVAAAMNATNKGIQGFNGGAFKTDYSAKTREDFEKEMTTAQGLENSPGMFNSVRLFTSVQYETDNTPIEAFEAALATDTRLLLGI